MKTLTALVVLGIVPSSVLIAQATAPVSSDGLTGLLTGSAVTVLAAGVIAFIRGWIVPGKVHDRVISENDILREELRARNKEDRDTLIPMIVESMTQALQRERGEP